MKQIITTILILITIQPVLSKPLQGHVSNDIPLCKQRPALDPHGKSFRLKANQQFLRGLIGITYNAASGEITYIYPESDLNHFDIKTGDFILKIEKEAYKPCIMPNIVIYPNNYILNLTIRSKAGLIKTIPVKLIPYSNLKSGG